MLHRIALRRWLVFTFALAIALTGLGLGPRAGLSAKLFDPDSFTLENGLQVVVITNRRAPIVTHMVWYKVGAADEPAGRSGIAHFLEHLMFKGTDSLGPGEFSDLIARNGGRENAFTSHDYTGYFQTIASDRLELVMKHEADRMANLKLTDELVLPERDVIQEERRSRVDNNPGSQLGEVMRATLFMNHPYRLPVIGWKHEIQSLTTEDALAFYERWYAPNNAILIVAGDVSTEEVRRLAETYYGAIPARAIPPRVRPSEPPQMAARRVVLESPQVGQPTLTMSFLAPSYNMGEVWEAYALQVLDEILGGGPTSRLYRSLIIDQAIATSAGSGYGATNLDQSAFNFQVTPRPGVEMDAIEAALRQVLADAVENGIDAEEVADAKTRLLADAVYARDRLSTGARIIGAALTSGLTVEEVEAWPERIEAVTVDQVNAVLAALIDESRSVTGLLLPEPTS